MHLNWQVMGIAVGSYAVATFVAYMPDPKEGDAWWYAPLWHMLQFLAANLAKSQTVLKNQPPKP